MGGTEVLESNLERKSKQKKNERKLERLKGSKRRNKSEANWGRKERSRE